jgi:DNA polymerase (family 10)
MGQNIMTNAEIAKVFDEIADLLEMKGENQFKIRAYRQAARTIKKLPSDLEQMVRKGEKLEDIPGVGEAIAKKIEDLVNTGHVKVHDELKAEFPQGILDILNIPGVGAKTAMRLYTELGVKSVAELERAVREGRVAAMQRMGEGAAQKILKSIESGEKRHSC